MDIKRTFLQDPQHNSAFMSYLSQQNSISFKLSTTDLYKIPQSLPPLPCQLLKGKENLNELSQSQSFQQSQAQTEFALYGQWQRDETAQTLRKEESGTISSKRQLCYCQHKPGIKTEMETSSSEH